MKSTALITGATSGIGKATAELLAKSYRLIICGRRTERLEKLAKKLQKVTDVHVLSFDVRNRDEVFKSIESLPDAWKQIDVLINNAGNAHGMNPIHEGNLDDWDAMIDINVKGLLYVSRAILPQMVERKTGHVVNIGSIAGIEVYSKGNVYNASKYAVDALSRSMRMDLIEHGIRVTEIKPGLVETEFSEVRFKGDKAKAGKVYAGLDPLQGHDIAEAIEFALSRPPNVNIADMLIVAGAQATATMVNRRE